MITLNREKQWLNFLKSRRGIFSQLITTGRGDEFKDAEFDQALYSMRRLYGRKDIYEKLKDVNIAIAKKLDLCPETIR